MDPKIRQRVHDLETGYLGHPNPVNSLCVLVARLEAELAKVRQERDQYKQAAEEHAEVAG